MKKLFTLACVMLMSITSWANDITFAPSDFAEMSSAAAFSTEKNGIKIEVSNGRTYSEHIRIYKNQTITISSSATIKKIVFTCTATGSAQYGPGSFGELDGYTFESDGNTGTWEGTSNSITFTASNNQVRATSIVVTTGAADPTYVAPPTFSVTEGTYFSPQTVELSCATEGAKIIYTIPDGTDPEYTDDENYTGNFYTDPIVVSKNTVIKAMAVKGGYKSEIVSATYNFAETSHAGTVEDPFTVADALTVIATLANKATTTSEVYVKGIAVGTVTVSSGQAQFLISDTGENTNTVTVYKAKGQENKDYTEGDVKEGDEVVIYAKLQKYNETSETQYGYIYSVNGKTTKESTDPDPVVFVGDGSEANPYLVSDLQQMSADAEAQADKWVTGVIIGSASSATELKAADSNVASNLALAVSADATTFIPVELKSGSVFRTTLNVLDNADMIGKTVLLKGTITKYFGVVGLKTLTDAKVNGESIVTAISTVKTAAQNGLMYNVAGQVVNKGYKGLIIMNGKKFVNK